METISVWRIVSKLALWLAILAFAALAEAMPNRQALYILAEDKAAGAISVQPMDLNLTQDGVASEDWDVSPAQTASTLRHEILSVTEESRSSANAPCLNDISTTGLAASLDPADAVCAEPADTHHRFGIRFGRRVRTRSGMLGDFDGVMIDYRFGPVVVNGIAGFPAASGKKELNPEKQVFGVSAGTGTEKLAGAWDLNGYLMERQQNGQTNGSALGGALRYSRANRSVLVSGDYDLLNRGMSRFMVSSAWRLAPTTTLSTTIDVHQSNLPTPQENYLQQTMALTEGWKWGLPLDRIRSLSGDSSTDVATIALSLSHALSQRVSVSGDLAMLEVSKDGQSEDMETDLPNANEYYVYLKLSGKNLVQHGDSSVFTLKHSVGDFSRISSVSLDGSYPINHQWHLTPRLRSEYRDNPADDSRKWSASPAVKVEYRWHRQSRLDIEAGGEWSRRQAPNEEQRQTSYFVSLGYRADF